MSRLDDLGERLRDLAGVSFDFLHDLRPVEKLTAYSEPKLIRLQMHVCILHFDDLFDTPEVAWPQPPLSGQVNVCSRDSFARNTHGHRVSGNSVYQGEIDQWRPSSRS